VQAGCHDPVDETAREEFRITDSSQLRELFRTGRAPIERKLAVCTGTVSLDPADRAEILVLLSADSDERIASRAANALMAIEPANFTEALARTDAAPQLFTYCAEYLADKPGIAQALIAHPGCPPSAIVQAVIHLPADAARALADNLSLLSLRPELPLALLASPALSPEQKHAMKELGQGVPEEAAIAEAVKDAEPDPYKRQSLLQRLARMRVIERVQLALKGGREERLALVRDPCRVVQRAVLQSARLTEREVESFAAMANLSEEVLRVIAMNRLFRKNYAIIKNLVHNPKTPLDISLQLLNHIQTPDLKLLTVNKNIPETLRSTALRTHRQRTATRH